MAAVSKRKSSFLKQHSLSIVTAAILTVWIIGYSQAEPDTRWGSFFGNAVADWSGSLVIILGTKFLLEKGSAESMKVKRRKLNPFLEFIRCHSLLLFLAVTGTCWMRMSPTDKWGQVVGNIVSEWLQMAGLVFLTKGLIERGSKDSN